MNLAGFCDKNIIVSDEALHCGGGHGVKPFFVRAKPCLPLWSFSLIRKTELLVAFNITSGIEVSFFSVILNFLIFPVSESLNLYSNSSTHSLMRYKSIKQLKTKIQEDIY